MPHIDDKMFTIAIKHFQMSTITIKHFPNFNGKLLWCYSVTTKLSAY